MKINPKRDSIDQFDGLHDLCNYVADRIDAGTMVEIGSWMGESALEFASYFDLVICVDPFEGKFAAVLPIFQRAVEIDLRSRQVGRAPVIEHIRKTGEEARPLITNQVDFVYIDAVHEYEPVKSDINYWRHKVKAIGGHDYSAEFPGVKQAVDEAFGDPDMVFQDTSWVKVL